MGALKKFLSNKTTVTFLGIIIGVVILVVGYTYRVEKSVSSIKLPVAKRTILPTEEITADDIKYVRVSSSFLAKSNVYTEGDINSIVNHYVNVGTSIPKGGAFYKTQVVEKKELPNSIFDSIPDGYTIYQLRVNNESTFANSIYPGDHINLWLSTNVMNKLAYGEFISNIEVFAVRDENGNNVFDVTSGRTSAYLLFAVKTSMYRYLKIAEMLGIAIVPVPVNNYYVDPGQIGATKYSNKDLCNMVFKDSGRIITVGGDIGIEETCDNES